MADLDECILQRLCLRHAQKPGSWSSLDEIVASYPAEAAGLRMAAPMSASGMADALARALPIEDAIKAVASLFARGALERQDDDQGDRFRVSQLVVSELNKAVEGA